MVAESTSPKGQLTAFDPQLLPFGNTEWIKSLSGAPTKICAAGWERTLAFTAERLQDQAAYLKQLSQCTDPAEALKLNASFSQQFFASLWDDAMKFFDGVRTSIASVVPDK